MTNLIVAAFAWLCVALIAGGFALLFWNAFSRPIDKAFDQPFGDVPEVPSIHDERNAL